MALEYAWQQWDKDKDGVMEGIQHNTYDIEFHGPNTMMGSFYLGALRAAEEMARYLGEEEKADEYKSIFESGKAWMDEHLFNGEWYRQEVRPGGDQLNVPIEDWPKYQYGDGCLSDQMIGQWFARIVGLGDLFDPGHVRKTMASIFKYNWLSDLSEHSNPQRIYALNDEAGLLACSWPGGGRPALPFVYSDEVWCGIEYQVAAHLIYEGLVEEGLAVVKGVRDRHDGERRNPWNEFECGNHYARSMASYSVLLALSGFHYSAPARRISFAPRVHGNNFACFFSVDSGWGMYRQHTVGDRPLALKRTMREGGKKTELEPYVLTDWGISVSAIQIRKGSIVLQEVGLPFNAENAEVYLAGQFISAQVVKGETGMVLHFAEPIDIGEGETLTVLAM
jgi:hypothetical protein